MSDSYYRKCKYCGRRIQMRKMPHGKYVAFEGYDTVHDCKNPPEKKHTTSWTSRKKKKDKSYIDINIPNISIGSLGRKSNPPSYGNNKKEPINKTKEHTVTKGRSIEEPKKDSIPIPQRLSKRLSISDYIRRYWFIALLILIVIFTLGILSSNDATGYVSSTNEKIINTSHNSTIVARTNTIKTISPIPTFTQNQVRTPKTVSPEKSDVTSEGCLENVSSMYVRSCPSVESEIIGVLHENIPSEKCQILVGRDTQNTWVLTDEGGWINGYYLDIEGSTINLPIISCEEEE